MADILNWFRAHGFSLTLVGFAVWRGMHLLAQIADWSQQQDAGRNERTDD